MNEALLKLSDPDLTRKLRDLYDDNLKFFLECNARHIQVKFDRKGFSWHVPAAPRADYAETDFGISKLSNEAFIEKIKEFCQANLAVFAELARRHWGWRFSHRGFQLFLPTPDSDFSDQNDQEPKRGLQ